MPLVIDTIKSIARAIVSELTFKCEALHRNAKHLLTSAQTDAPLQTIVPKGCYPVFILSPNRDHAFMFFVDNKNINVLTELESVMESHASKLSDGYAGDWTNEETDSDSQAIFAFMHNGSRLYATTPRLKTKKNRKLYVLSDGEIKGERIQNASGDWEIIHPDDMKPL